MLWLSLTFQHVFALVPKQKIFPGDLQKAAFFGWNSLHSGNLLFVSDPEHKTTDVNRGCNIGYGAMHIYKQSGVNWTLSQSLLPDYNTSFENKLGRKFSYKNNILVLSAEREDYSATVTRSGAFYAYSRPNESSNFTRIAKVFAPSPIDGGEFTGAGVATNGSKIVVYNSAQSLLNLYNVTGSSVSYAGALNIGNAAGEIQGITDNNIVVIQNGNAVRLFRIDGNSFTEISGSSIIPASSSETLAGLASVNGNSIVFSAATNFSSGNSSAYIRVVKLGYNTVESVYDIRFPLGLTYKVDTSAVIDQNPYIVDLYIKENSAIALSVSKGYQATTRTRVVLLNYIDGQYRQTDILESPSEYDNVMSVWGSSVALSGSQIFIGDFTDRTNFDSGTTPCNRKNASGAVYVYDLNVPVTNGANGSRISSNVFPELGDETGSQVAINGNYALVSHPGSDNADVNAGAVSLLKKINGQWYFEKKFYSVISDVNEYYGSSVALSSNFAAIGAKGINNNKGIVHTYQILSSSGVKIEDAPYTFVSAPDEVVDNLFGDVVATDGNYLAVSATGDDSQGSQSGAVYIFNWNGSYWNFIQKILPASLGSYQGFGASLSLKGDYLAIGAAGDDNANGTDAGAVYIYKLNSGSFSYSQKLIPANFGLSQNFGQHVSIGADYLAVSHKKFSTNQGFVTLFKRTNQTWTSEQVLIESTAGASFGDDVAIDGTRLLVGSPSEGKVYRYERYSNWTKTGAFSVGGVVNYNSIDVAINGDNVILGDVTNNGVAGEAYLMYFYQIGGAREAIEDESIFSEMHSSAGVYPNPASENIVSVFGMEDVFKVEAYSSSGILAGELPFKNGQVDISLLKTGLYILNIHNSNGIKVFKLSVQ